MSYISLCKHIGYQFEQESLLSQALTHRSADAINNERLEYLGDSIINFVIAEALFIRFSTTPEGQLSRMRASLVKKETLAEIAKQLHLGDYIRLGSGELKSGGYRRESILADTLEALIASIYLDANLDICKNKILHWFAEKLTTTLTDTRNKDAKTELQEFLQARHLSLPKYQITKIIGEDHQQIFHVSCRVSGLSACGNGKGESRRRAEQIAAAQLLAELKHE